MRQPIRNVREKPPAGQGPITPLGHLISDRVGDLRDRVLGDLGPVDLAEVRRDLSGRQPAGGQGQHDLADVRERSLRPPLVAYVRAPPRCRRARGPGARVSSVSRAVSNTFFVSRFNRRPEPTRIRWGLSSLKPSLTCVVLNVGLPLEVISIVEPPDWPVPAATLIEAAPNPRRSTWWASRFVAMLSIVTVAMSGIVPSPGMSPETREAVMAVVKPSMSPSVRRYPSRPGVFGQ